VELGIAMSKVSAVITDEMVQEFETRHKAEFDRLKSEIGSLSTGKIEFKGLQDLFSSLANIQRSFGYVEAVMGIPKQSKALLTPKQKSLILLFTYLTFAEGIFSEVIEIIIFFLLQSHHDLYDPRRAEFVKEYKQIEKIDLFIKLKFIENHGFGFLCDSIDRDLRNSIAHLNLIVDDDGCITNSKTAKVNIIGALLRLIWVTKFTIEEVSKVANGIVISGQK
jgi:hypothetical protein